MRILPQYLRILPLYLRILLLYLRITLMYLRISLLYLWIFPLYLWIFRLYIPVVSVDILAVSDEPQNEKMYLLTCTPNKNSNLCASAQYDQGLRSTHEETLHLWLFNITKTYLYNFDPLKPHFYIVKLGFTGVYIIFLISAQKHRLWVLVRTASPRRF